ncbi:MAG: alkylresorcinol/alkylpyrone synthase [Alphaproteobacteria bacterium]|jgi:alkylresorcinol/alkylpyrone synthase|nr:alkylresorcinol/alkylpyrone synthase [Alphaproteobacteria bacterium]
MITPVSILALATAVPPHLLEQARVAERMQSVFARLFSRYPGLADVFTNAGIERRHSVRPLDWFDAPHDWSERTEAYLDGADALFVQATEAALMRAGISARDVDVIVTVSSTGIATPSLEARVGRQLGFRPDVSRIPVFGLGCAGGVSGLSIAARLARAEPGDIVLVVVVELCTLAFRRDRGSKADVIATALFGDGAAAVLMRAGGEPSRLRIGATREHMWPGTLDVMGWSVDPIGFGVVLSRSLPRFVEERLAAPARRFVKEAGLNGATRFICHPGGTKVLAAVEAALELDPGTLDDEREVLRDFGNMSAPTVLFVLERALTRGLSGPAVLSALGPGFTASFLAIEAGDG